MTLTEFMRFAVLSAACAVAARSSANDALELADLAGRIDYGFYVDDARAIEAALPALLRLGDDDPAVEYLRAYAAFRRELLAAAHGQPVEPLRAECLEHAKVRALEGRPSREQGKAYVRAGAEAAILAAACAGVAGSPDAAKGLARDRSVQQSLARARDLDPTNPRLALLDAWLVSRRPALSADPAVRDAATAKLEEALAAFANASPPAIAPDWGEAEALAALAEVALARGEARHARDLIERALLVAPGYAFATELRARLAGARSAPR